VQVGRGDHDPVTIDAAALDGVVGDRRFGEGDAVVSKGEVVLPAAGAAVHVWDIEKGQQRG
jgi:hypothetical protein